MNKLIKILGVIGIVVCAVFTTRAGKKIFFRLIRKNIVEGKKERGLSSILMQTANQLNQSLPIMLDSGTRLDSSIGTNKQFRYNYTLINYTADESVPSKIESIMHPQLINRVCTSKEMEIFIKNGISVAYAYHGKNGKHIITITVLPSDCKGKRQHTLKLASSDFHINRKNEH